MRTLCGVVVVLGLLVGQSLAVVKVVIDADGSSLVDGQNVLNVHAGDTVTVKVLAGADTTGIAAIAGRVKVATASTADTLTTTADSWTWDEAWQGFMHQQVDDTGDPMFDESGDPIYDIVYPNLNYGSAGTNGAWGSALNYMASVRLAYGYVMEPVGVLPDLQLVAIYQVTVNATAAVGSSVTLVWANAGNAPMGYRTASSTGGQTTDFTQGLVLNVVSLDFSGGAQGMMGGTQVSSASEPATMDLPGGNSWFVTPAVAAATDHSLALTSGGTVWGWGNDNYGQLGDQWGDGFENWDAQWDNVHVELEATTPIQVRARVGQQYQPLTGVIAVAAGNASRATHPTGGHSLALGADGTVWAWGDNYFGQLGNGESGDGKFRRYAQQVPGLTNVVGIAAGECFSLAVKADGTVWAWGLNIYGQIGDGTGGYIGYYPRVRSEPAQVTGLTSVVAVAAGYHHSLAVKSDGTVWTWGNNAGGQLGVNSTNASYVPVQVRHPDHPGDAQFYLQNIVSVAGGGGHSLAVDANGRVYAWGWNDYGQLGIGSTGNSQTVPVKLTAPADFYGATIKIVAAGDQHTLAIDSNGGVWGWGRRDEGEVGIGDGRQPLTAPAQVDSGHFNSTTKALAVAAGRYQSLAMRSEGGALWTAWSWGYNEDPVLGNGGTDEHDPYLHMTPALVESPDSPQWNPLEPPAPITNLAAPGSSVQRTSLVLTWTATGAHGNTGTAARYDLRCGTNPITNIASFSAATPVAGVPLPAAAGTNQNMTVTGLAMSTTYYFAVVVYNTEGDASGLSNVVMVTTKAAHKTGDINDDGYVNVGDLQALVAAWGSQAGPPPSSNWNANADLNQDGYVNVGDLQILVAHWGE